MHNFTKKPIPSNILFRVFALLTRMPELHGSLWVWVQQHGRNGTISFQQEKRTMNWDNVRIRLSKFIHHKPSIIKIHNVHSLQQFSTNSIYSIPFLLQLKLYNNSLYSCLLPCTWARTPTLCQMNLCTYILQCLPLPSFFPFINGIQQPNVYIFPFYPFILCDKQNIGRTKVEADEEGRMSWLYLVS